MSIPESEFVEKARKSNSAIILNEIRSLRQQAKAEDEQLVRPSITSLITGYQAAVNNNPYMQPMMGMASFSNDTNSSVKRSRKSIFTKRYRDMPEFEYKDNSHIF